jgi:hypothetical protein
MLQRGQIRKWGEFDKGCRTISLDVERDDAAPVDVEESDQAVGPPIDADAEMSKLSSTERPSSLDVADDGPFQTNEALEVREEGQVGEKSARALFRIDEGDLLHERSEEAPAVVTAAEHVDENIERIYIGQKKVFKEIRDGESLSKMGGPGGSAPTRSKADTGSTGTHVPLSTDLAKEHKHPLASYALSEVVHDIGRPGRALKGRGKDLLSDLKRQLEEAEHGEDQGEDWHECRFLVSGLQRVQTLALNEIANLAQ